MSIKKPETMPITGRKSAPKTDVKQGEILPPTPPKIDLHDAHSIRRELASLYRDARSGRVETQDATRMAYILDLLRKSFETADFQRRLDSLEHILNRRKQR